MVVSKKIYILPPLISPPGQGPSLFRVLHLSQPTQVSPGQVMQLHGQERKFRRGIPLLTGGQLVLSFLADLAPSAPTEKQCGA